MNLKYICYEKEARPQRLPAVWFYFTGIPKGKTVEIETTDHWLPGAGKRLR